MENEKLLTELYEKMAAEQERYRHWLLGQPPGEILDHACEYTVREDMVMEMEGLELTDAQAKALLKSPSPLADVYKDWEKRDFSGHMEDIREVIESRANDVIRAQRDKLREAR